MSKNKKPTPNSLRNVTIFFGYSFFLLLLVLLAINLVVPWTVTLLRPEVNHLNIILSITTFVAVGALPSLISYIIGDKATHSKDKIKHHYNGVLFGIATYWLALFFSFMVVQIAVHKGTFGFSHPWWMLYSGWPIVAIIGIMAFVAFTYAHHQKKKDSVLEHRPYQIVLIGSVIASLAYILPNQYYEDPIFLITGVLFLAMPLIFTAISYMVLAKTQSTRMARLTAALIAMTIGMIASYLAGQVVSSYTYSMFVPFVAGTVVWIAYLWLVVRKSK